MKEAGAPVHYKKCWLNKYPSFEDNYIWFIFYIYGVRKHEVRIASLVNNKYTTFFNLNLRSRTLSRQFYTLFKILIDVRLEVLGCRVTLSK